MRKRIWFFLTVISIVVTVCGCTQTSSATPTPTRTPRLPTVTLALPTPLPTTTPTESPTLTPTPSAANDFEIVTHPNAQDAVQTDVILRNSKTGEENLFVTLKDVNASHYHVGEYHRGNVYLIRVMGYDHETGTFADDWSHQLWRYDVQGQGTQLYTAQGIDFRVTSDEGFIAVGYSPDGMGTSRVAFLNTRGDLLQEFTVDQLGNGDFQNELTCDLEEWSDDGQAFWGKLSRGLATPFFYKVLVPSWQVVTYDISQSPVKTVEYDLNINTGQLVYSDYPAMFDLDSLKAFEDSQRPVILSIYDFDGQSKQDIATAVAKSFNPIWLDDHTIEYDNPDGEGRIVYAQ